MQIQLNTSNGIQNKASLERWADQTLRQQLHRYADELIRIEVHLSDESGAHRSASDKRCVMEARLANHAPLAVTHDGGSTDDAFRGALDKLKRQLAHRTGRDTDHRDRSSIRTGAGPQPEEPEAPEPVPED